MLDNTSQNNTWSHFLTFAARSGFKLSTKQAKVYKDKTWTPHPRYFKILIEISLEKTVHTKKSSNLREVIS
mgnify:CR=1 FL=1